MIRRFVCLVLLVSIVPAVLSQENIYHEPSGIVITGATLIDGTGVPPRPNSVVVIRKNRIVRVGDRVLPEDLDDALVINASGQFVIPGLIDAHIHNSSPASGVREIERNFQLFLANGVTSTFDVGGDLTIGLMMKRAIDGGKLVGPRVFLAGPILHAESGLASARTPEEVTQLVNSLVNSGVDLIKFYTCFTPPLVEAAIKAGHARGVPVSGHHGLTSPIESAELGIDIVHHALTSMGEMAVPAEERRRILNSPGSLEELGHQMEVVSRDAMGKATPEEFQKFARELVLSNPSVVSTLLVNFAYITYQQPYERYEAYDYLSKEGRQRWDSTKKMVIRQLAESPNLVTQEKLKKRDQWVYTYWKLGGKLIAGTDTPTLGVQSGFSLQKELELIRNTGIPAMATIMSATKLPAEAIRRGKDLGTVEVGKLADLLILKADPLVDISNTRLIRFVVKDGRVYDPQQLLRQVRLEDRRQELADQ